MLRVFIILLASVAAGPIVDSDLFGVIIFNIDSTLYRASIALSYLSISALGLWMAKVELSKWNNYNAALICIICFFMVSNALLNLLMADHTMYYSLACFKKGLDCNTLTFNDVYRAVEILISLIVGFNVFYYIANMDICAHGSAGVILRDDTNIN